MIWKQKYYLTKVDMTVCTAEGKTIIICIETKKKKEGKFRNRHV